MKLHLPVALLTAVISAMAYGAEPAYTIDRTMGSDIQGGTYNNNDVIVNVTGGDFAKYNMGGVHTHRGIDGAIQGASETDVMPNDHNNIPTYGDIYLNVSGGENISWVIGEGVPTPVKVTGDKNINVTGGEIDYIVGGVNYASGTNGFTGVGNATTVSSKINDKGETVNTEAQWAHKDDSNPDINISVTGGTVGQIRGGNNNNSANVYNSLKYAQSTGTDLMTDKPWAVAGDVNISVGGDAVVGDGKKAIAGAGGSGHSVDGSVNIDITGGTINGNIYAGTTNIYTEVKSTSVAISGGTINGNVFGGGNYDDGADKASDYGLNPAEGPTVKGNTEVVLSGGTINGSVYAAGDKDIVEGDTRVVINGTQAKVTGDISGGGINGADVQGNSILAIKNSGGLGVSWDQFKDFNALEIENSQLALGTPDSGHKLSSQFQNVSVEHSNIFGNIDHAVLFEANDSVVDIKGSFTTKEGSSIKDSDGTMTVGGNATFNGTAIDNSSIVAAGDMYIQDATEVTNSQLSATNIGIYDGSVVNGGTITANKVVQLEGATVTTEGLTAQRLNVYEGSNLTLNGGSHTLSKNGAALVIKGESTMLVDNGAEVKSTQNTAQLAIESGTLKVDNGSTVDFSKGQTTIVGEYVNKADAAEGHIILDNESTFIGGATNAWLTSGSVELYGNSTMELCTSSKADHNYRTIIGLYDSNEFEILVSEGSTLTSSAYALVTNYMSNTTVNIKVDGVGADGNASTFTQKALTSWGRDTNTYLLDSGVDNNGNKPIPTSNNAVLNVTASNGGHFNIESGVTYIGSAQDKEIYGEHLNKTANFTISGEGSKVSFNQLEVYANTNIINADGTFKATDITVHEDALLTHVGSGKLTADSLTVNGAMKFGSTEGGRSQMEIANDATMANSTITNADVKVGGALTLNKGNVAGSTLTSTGGNMYIQDASTVTDSKLSATNIGIYDGSVVNGGTITAGKVVQLEGATVTTEGLSAQRLNVYEGSELTLNGGSHTLSKNGAALVIKGESTMLVDNGAVVKSTQNTAQMAIESGTLKVDNGSTVDFSKGQTTIVGEYVNKANAAEGHIILDNGSTFIGGATNAWLTSGSVELYGGSTMELCTSSKADHNYRTIIGLYDSNEFEILVSEGSTLTSSAYALVTNYMSNTAVAIKVDGAGSSFTQNAQTSWGRDTNTYLLDSGVDNNGNKPIPTSNNAVINVTASNGGHFNIESGMTYIGSAQDHEIYGDNLNKTANFTISGDGSKVSFKDVQVYANTVIENEGGSFTAEDLKVHEGATFSHEGNGKITASSIAVDGTMLIGSEAGGRSQMTLNVPVTGTASYSGKINGQLTINNADFIVKGEVASQFGIGIGGEGSMLVTGGSDVNLSRGTTLVLGRDGGAGKLTVADGSVLKGGSNNLWVYGNSEIHVTEGSNMEVCSGGDHNNYRVLLGLTNTGDATTEQTILVDKGASFTSHAYEFVSHFHGGSTVNIVADGANSTFTQANTMNTGTFMGTNKTTTYLLDSGYDSKGNKYGAVDHVKANITASNGGKVSFDSDVTYVGSAQDKAAGYTDKKLNISVDSTSSMTFGDMVIYADTTIDNKGSLTVDDITVYDGATVENLGSLSLDEVVLSDATLYNAGELAMNSLVMDNATLLFAATALDSCSTFIYNGAGLTGYGISNVSAADMIQNFGVVMSGDAAAGLLQQWGAEVEFSFTLAQGSDQFEKEFAYVLEQNLADFTITLGDVAELTVGADEIKDLKVEDTANGVVISGIAVIPEPTTATLSLLALAALAARRRRK